MLTVQGRKPVAPQLPSLSTSFGQYIWSVHLVYCPPMQVFEPNASEHVLKIAPQESFYVDMTR
jgi:hypothetical protein